MSRRSLPTATFAALIAVSAHADTLTVPGDFPTIQAAIDASSDGDEIAVAPGTYGSTTDNVVDMKGRAVRLYATGGPDVTFIDGNDGTIRRRGILCQSGETNATVIEGFTIRNCFPTWYDWNQNEQVEIWEFFGGGMWNRGGSSGATRPGTGSRNLEHTTAPSTRASSPKSARKRSAARRRRRASSTPRPSARPGPRRTSAF